MREKKRNGKRMRKKSLIWIGLAVLLASGIASASVLNYYGRIVATFNVIADSNIVLWLPMDEGSGYAVADISQYGNNGNLVNGPTWSTDCKLGGCISFDGVDDYVQIPGSASLDLTDAITMEAWVKLSPGGSSTWYDIIRRQTGYEVSISRDTGIIEIALNDGSWHWYDSLSAINRDGTTWYHIAATWDKSSGKVRIYINGNLDAELDGITDSLQPTGDLYIGSASSAWQTYGTIDNPRVWNVELTSAQINSIYQSGV